MGGWSAPHGPKGPRAAVAVSHRDSVNRAREFLRRVFPRRFEVLAVAIESVRGA